MSDGITEGYRASAASKKFREMWEEAQVENILLDIKSKLNDMSIEDLFLHIVNLSPHILVKNYDKFVIPYANGTYLSDSAPANTNHDKVRLYELEVSGKVYWRFVNSSLKESLKEAILFLEWLETEEGHRAAVVKNDY